MRISVFVNSFHGGNSEDGGSMDDVDTYLDWLKWSVGESIVFANGEVRCTFVKAKTNMHFRKLASSFAVQTR